MFAQQDIDGPRCHRVGGQHVDPACLGKKFGDAAHRHAAQHQAAQAGLQTPGTGRRRGLLGHQPFGLGNAFHSRALDDPHQRRAVIRNRCQGRLRSRRSGGKPGIEGLEAVLEARSAAGQYQDRGYPPDEKRFFHGSTTSWVSPLASLNTTLRAPIRSNGEAVGDPGKIQTDAVPGAKTTKSGSGPSCTRTRLKSSVSTMPRSFTMRMACSKLRGASALCCGGA